MKRKRMRTLILCGLMVLPAAAQDDPWKTEIDNSLVQVARRVVGPHETVSVTEMPPFLLVFVTECAVRLTTSARQEELQGKPGGFLWHAGGQIRLENLGDAAWRSRALRPSSTPNRPINCPPQIRAGWSSRTI